ncbi:hypothetical protein WJX77_001213 [Trebouxia sp. C0004]
MMLQVEESVLGKRKRQGIISAADKSQARIDHYFAFSAPTKQSSGVISASAVQNGRSYCGGASQQPSNSDALPVKRDSHNLQTQQLPGNEFVAADGVRDIRQSVAAENKAISGGPSSNQAADSRVTLADVDFKADSGPKLANCRDQIAVRQNLVTQSVATTSAQQDIFNHLAVFHAVLSERQQFREIAVAVKLSPEALVGRKLRVYWPEDDGWFLGTVAHYNAQTGQHRVEYDDGDRGDLHLAVERVRLLMHAGETFEPAKPAELEMLAKGLLTAANDKSAASPRTRKQCLSPSQEQQLKEAEEEAHELRKRSVELERLAQQLRAASRSQHVHQATQKALANGSASQQQELFRQEGKAQQQHQQQLLKQESDSQGHQAQVELETGNQQQQHQQPLHSPQGAGMQQHMQQEVDAQQLHMLNQDRDAHLLHAHQQQQLQGGDHQQQQLLKQQTVLQTSPPGLQEPQHQVEVHQEALLELVREKGKVKDTEQQNLSAEGQGKVQGLVVWGLTKGWPAWPALVITEEEIEVADVQGSRKNLQKGSGKVPVHYFGTQEFAWMKGKDIVSFGQGLHRGMHLCKASNRCKAAFQRALHEVSVYFLEGELPSEMVPKHNDDPYNDDKEEEQEQEPAPKAAKLLKPIDSSGVSMPLKLTSSLTVLSLGRIEYLHPAFHDVKNFWPAGYCVDRLAATPASGKKETLHRCEILEAPDGSGPLFRVTPKGCKPVEANTATKAWSALFTSQDSARALGYSGAKQFGLQHPRVQRLLQGMPGAARCERYAAWPGQPPPVPLLTDEEQRERQACEAGMQHLPFRIQPQTAQQPAGVCHVCYVEDYSDDNLLLECDRCRALVHMDCYGVEHAPQGQSWLCDVCALGPRVHHTPACVLCPVVGPPLRRTSCHRYCHVGCAQWLGETFILNGLVHGLPNVSKAKCQLTCYLCQQRYGACIQCAGSSKCFLAFHPSCARSAGLVMETVEPGSDYDTSEAESDADEAPAQEAVQQQTGSMDENHDTLNMPQTVCQGGRMKEANCNPPDLALQPPSSSEEAKDPPDQQKAAMESVKKTANAVSGIDQTKPLKTAALGFAHERKKRHKAPMQEGTYIGGGRRMMCYCPKHSHVARTPFPSRPVPALAPATAASLPAKAAAAPQTELEAAQGSEQQHNIGRTSDKGPQALFSGQSVAYQLPKHKAGCVRGLPFNHACRRGQREPDAIAAALAKRLFVAKTPYLIGAAKQHQQQQETVGRRLTCGKSAIHGLGAFTKQPHMSEDMVIEYAGEMVRPTVADQREAGSYNQLVGAGTYVFCLDDHFMVDATKAGNMAHLLNHSCQPNCYSKHVHVWDETMGVKVPHVVICAKQAIPVSEELTYDYRFSGKERLPCNCGATSCRGYVNKAAVQEDGLQPSPRVHCVHLNNSSKSAGPDAAAIHIVWQHP